MTPVARRTPASDGGGAIGTSEAQASRRDFKRRDKAKKARFRKAKDNSKAGAMGKQQRWNSCCSTTRIVVAPKPRPEQKTTPADERKLDEKQKGKAVKDKGIVAATREDAKAEIADASKSKAPSKPQRKVKEVKTKFVTWQQQTATAEAATSQRQAQIKTLQKAAVEATERRNSLLNYVPGDWDSVPEQLQYENATNIAQQIEEQETHIADTVKRAQRRMEREVKNEVTEHKAKVGALNEELQKLLVGNTKGKPHPKHT